MTKLAAPLAAAALIAGFAAPPALAQTANNRVNEIIVYGTDPCPRSTDDEVVVCKRVGEEERYRIPERLREGRPLPRTKRLAQILAFSNAIQALICASSASSGTAPCPSTASWNRRTSNFGPSCCSARERSSSILRF